MANYLMTPTVIAYEFLNLLEKEISVPIKSGEVTGIPRQTTARFKLSEHDLGDSLDEFSQKYIQRAAASVSEEMKRFDVRATIRLDIPHGCVGATIERDGLRVRFISTIVDRDRIGQFDVVYVV